MRLTGFHFTNGRFSAGARSFFYSPLFFCGHSFAISVIVRAQVNTKTSTICNVFTSVGEHVD